MKRILYRGVQRKGRRFLEGRLGVYWSDRAGRAAKYATMNVIYPPRKIMSGGVWMARVDLAKPFVNKAIPKLRGVGREYRIHPDHLRGAMRFVPAQQAWGSPKHGDQSLARRARKELSGKADAVRRAWATRRRKYGASGSSKNGLRAKKGSKR